MREEEVLNPFLDGVKGFGDPFVPCEFLAVVRRQGMNAGAEGGQQGDHGVRGGLGSLGRYMCNQRIAGLSFIERNESLSMTGTDNQIGFPVTEAAARIDDRRALLDRDLIWNGVSPVATSVVFSVSLLAAQSAMPCAVGTLVSVDAPVDAFVAHGRLPIDLAITGDLFWAPCFRKLGFDHDPPLRSNARAVLTGPHAGR